MFMCDVVKTVPVDVRSVPRLMYDLWKHLSLKRKIQYLLLSVLMLLSTLAEVLSIGAVVPFIAILVDPGRVYMHPLSQSVIDFFGIESAAELVLPLTIAFLVLAVLAGIIRVILLWFSNRLAFSSGADVSLEVYRKTLYRPYEDHLIQNSSEVVSTIINRINWKAAIMLYS